MKRIGPCVAALPGLVAVAWMSTLALAQSNLSVRELDSFAELAPWKAGASDGVKASVHPAQGVAGKALRLDFDLGGTAGYALAQRALAIDLPPNYELSFYVRADAPVNNFQVKLTDSSGDNVWWFNRPNFVFPRDWQLVRIKKRQIEFAWGPTKDPTLKHAERLEFVVAAGRAGGHGSVYVSRLELRELPPVPVTWPRPLVQASSFVAGAQPGMAVDGDRTTAWRSNPDAGSTQTLTLDFGMRREFGGIILRWAGGAYASRYDVQLSDDGAQWRIARRVDDGRGGPDALQLPDAEARFARLRLYKGPVAFYALAEIEIMDLAFGATPNAFFTAIARESPRGTYPRGYSGEQSYWTIVGVDGGSDSALLSEDGVLEVGRNGFTIEPFVISDSQVVTWADVETRQSLLENYLPIPSVVWRRAQWELRVTAFASGSRRRSDLIGRYELTNRSDQPLTLELALAVRPFQVDPPSQSLNAPGGVRPIHDIDWDGASLGVDGTRRIYPLRHPQLAGAFPFDAGSVRTLLSNSNWAGVQKVHDDFGYASAALAYRLSLAPHASAVVGIAVPLSGGNVRPYLQDRSPESWLAHKQDLAASEWRQKLNRVVLQVPPAAQPLVDTLRTSLAHILMTRDGPILRPGTRSYARSWIRDGAMMAESLLRLGHEKVAADYARWYAPYQFATGKVPCCVDDRGADPVPENDSPGEFIWLVAEIYRYTHDRTLLEAMWPHVASAARYLDEMRKTQRSEAYLAASMRPLYGLLPASISHEGYSEKPMHSYWDDFWGLKGFDGAIEIAAALGHAADSKRLRDQRAQFCGDVASSLLASAKSHGIAYLPGSAELGDFDPTSTAIAFAPGGDSDALPPALVGPTFERYWREFTDRRDGHKAWDVYTPYELRTVGTMIRLGERQRAHEELDFFLDGRRPSAWNQWAEVVGREPRVARFVGDMPHGWIASDFIRSTLDLFAYERAADHAIVLAAGVSREWTEGAGVELKGLRTPYGAVSYSLKTEGKDLVLRLAGAAKPPGGFVLAWPMGESGVVLVNGKPVQAQEGELRINAVPATVVLSQR
ncbi:MAG: hypothetical protein E6H66_04975 [Betaproteobacteria bacterium]|nr:MAG: hypothetical protein E6H66_04975 [Betaproteobacteria bacterium]